MTHKALDLIMYWEITPRISLPLTMTLMTIYIGHLFAGNIKETDPRRARALARWRETDGKYLVRFCAETQRPSNLPGKLNQTVTLKIANWPEITRAKKETRTRSNVEMFQHPRRKEMSGQTCGAGKQLNDLNLTVSSDSTQGRSQILL